MIVSHEEDQGGREHMDAQFRRGIAAGCSALSAEAKKCGSTGSNQVPSSRVDASAVARRTALGCGAVAGPQINMSTWLRCLQQIYETEQAQVNDIMPCGGCVAAATVKFT
jgi:hypothetical protein